MTAKQHNDQLIILLGQVIDKLNQHGQEFKHIHKRLESLEEGQVNLEQGINSIEQQMNAGFEAISDEFEEIRKEREIDRAEIQKMKSVRLN